MLDFFGAIGRMLPGYVQGERQAIADNWNDLEKYNKVQAGQLENAFTEDTYNPRFNIMLHNTARSQMGMEQDLMNLNLNYARYPGLMDVALVNSESAGPLAAQQAAMQMAQFAALQNMFNSPLWQQAAMQMAQFAALQNMYNSPLWQQATMGGTIFNPYTGAAMSQPSILRR